MFDDVELGITCEGFAHNKCTAMAIYVVGVHYLDHCRESLRTNTNGDRQWLLCPECARKVSDGVKKFMPRIFPSLPDQCRTCKKTVAGLHDLFTLEKLVIA